MNSTKKIGTNKMKKRLDDNGIEYEYYVPPGLSIGASCGSFLMDYDKYIDL